MPGLPWGDTLIYNGMGNESARGTTGKHGFIKEGITKMQRGPWGNTLIPKGVGNKSDRGTTGKHIDL